MTSPLTIRTTWASAGDGTATLAKRQAAASAGPTRKQLFPFLMPRRTIPRRIEVKACPPSLTWVSAVFQVVLQTDSSGEILVSIPYGDVRRQASKRSARREAARQ